MSVKMLTDPYNSIHVEKSCV